MFKSIKMVLCIGEIFDVLGLRPLNLCFVAIFHLFDVTFIAFQILFALSDQFELLRSPVVNLSALLFFWAM